MSDGLIIFMEHLSVCWVISEYGDTIIDKTNPALTLMRQEGSNCGKWVSACQGWRTQGARGAPVGGV